MKKVILITTFLAIILASLGGLYILINPSCCFADVKNNQISLPLHAKEVDFKKAIETGNYKLIDIRTTQEFNQGHIQGAVQIDFYQTKEFNTYLDSIDKNSKYLIYCRSGNRTGQAIKLMQEKGFKNISDLSGGINSWISSSYPLVK